SQVARNVRLWACPPGRPVPTAWASAAFEFGTTVRHGVVQPVVGALEGDVDRRQAGALGIVGDVFGDLHPLRRRALQPPGSRAVQARVADRADDVADLARVELDLEPVRGVDVRLVDVAEGRPLADEMVVKG